MWVAKRAYQLTAEEGKKIVAQDNRESENPEIEQTNYKVMRGREGVKYGVIAD